MEVRVQNQFAYVFSACINNIADHAIHVIIFYGLYFYLVSAQNEEKQPHLLIQLY